MTTFGTAIGEREKLGWCSPCWKTREKNMRMDKDGNQKWIEPPGLYRRRGMNREEEKT